MLKTCSRCHVPKSLSEFHKHKDYAFGVHAICRVCRSHARAAERRAQGIKPLPPFLSRVWDNIQTCGHGEVCLYCCWPWKPTQKRGGYGRIKIRKDGRAFLAMATHVVYELWHTIPLPPDKCIAHHCDNPPCCNPLHLFPATYQENTDDAKRKGRIATGHLTGPYTQPDRAPRGERHGNARFTTADIQAIRRLRTEGKKLKDLAHMFETSVMYVFEIVHYKAWKHL